jgi:glutathione S-transferase
MEPLLLIGGYGSPYSRKMRAVLRYRRIPFRWIMRGSPEDVGIPPVPVALIPVLVFPAQGSKPAEAMIDSTFQILRLERMFQPRSLVPPDPAIAFLHSLIEDYGDEWLTKAMFHYRWNYAPDIAKAGHVLILDRMIHLDGSALERAAKMISDRQIARLTVVGSNPTTRPVIEDSYRRLLAILDRIVAGGAPFVGGWRPGVGDFGLFGQLSQLVLFDPTPAAIAAEVAPRVFSWVHRIEDLSWLEVDDNAGENSGWIGRDAIATLNPLFVEIGRVYATFLIANARALNAKAAQVECTIDGRQWVQQPFPYQGKCLNWLRESYRALTESDRRFVDRALAGTGCEAIFTASV